MSGAAVQPRVSVVIPTYRRPDLLQRCLAAVQVQTLPAAEYEIIVCDDGPSDQARAVVESAKQSNPAGPTIHYLPITETQGPAGARNQGWRHARGPVIAFTDDDTVPDPSWLEAGLRAMDDDVDAITGSIEMPLPEQPTDLELDAAGLTRAEFVTANCFVRRQVLAEVNGFDERFSIAWREDSDLHFTLIERGYRLRRVPEAKVVHPLRDMRFAAAIGMQKKVLFDVLLYCKHPKLYRERIRRTPPWFYLSICFFLGASILFAIFGQFAAAAIFLALWAITTLWFFWKRLMPSAKTWRNIVELLLTSIAIPPLSIFWRLIGIRRFGAKFP